MKERPILFSADMVRAILDGRKVQTRRIVKTRYPLDYLGGRGYEDDPENWGWAFDGSDGHGYMVLAQGLYETMPGGSRSIPCPYGAPGDRLWVRETFAANVYGCESQCGYSYRADHNDPRGDGPANPMRWTPSIHMPRRASRITLLITAIRAERVQDITDDDALREGIPALAYGADESPRDGFRELWERTYPGSWEQNDGVWVVEFQRVER